MLTVYERVAQAHIKDLDVVHRNPRLESIMNCDPEKNTSFKVNNKLSNFKRAIYKTFGWQEIKKGQKLF